MRTMRCLAVLSQILLVLALFVCIFNQFHLTGWEEWFVFVSFIFSPFIFVLGEILYGRPSCKKNPYYLDDPLMDDPEDEV